jgi:hypothetical protein
MTRSRVVLVSSLTFVAVAAALAIGALLLDPARAAVGPLPAAALALPADVRFVVGVDVHRLVASPLWQRFGGPRGERQELFREIADKTGLDPEKDVDQIVFAGRGADGPRSGGVVMVFARFDQGQLARTIEAEKGVTWNKVGGRTLYLFREDKPGSGALGFLDDDVLVLGSRAEVEAVLTNATQRGGGLRGNAALTRLLERVKPGSVFWMVGDQSLLSKLPSSIAAPGAEAGSGASLTLPSLESLTVTGDLDPLLAIELAGEAADEAAARNLADVVRGFVALAQLQAGQKPELRELASAVSVTTDQTRVLVSARLPYTLLDSLNPKKAAERRSKVTPDPQ